MTKEIEREREREILLISLVIIIKRKKNRVFDASVFKSKSQNTIFFLYAIIKIINFKLDIFYFTINKKKFFSIYK